MLEEFGSEMLSASIFYLFIFILLITTKGTLSLFKAVFLNSLNWNVVFL